MLSVFFHMFWQPCDDWGEARYLDQSYVRGGTRGKLCNGKLHFGQGGEMDSCDTSDEHFWGRPTSQWRATIILD